MRNPPTKNEKSMEYVVMVDRAMQTDDDPYAMEIPLQVEMVPPNSNNSFNSDILRQIKDEEKKASFSESMIVMRQNNGQKERISAVIEAVDLLS